MNSWVWCHSHTLFVPLLLVNLFAKPLQRYFGFDTRPRTKYGHVLARQEKMKKEAEARRKKKSR